MQRTSCLAIILVVIVLAVWYVFVMPRLSPKEQEKEEVKVEEKEKPAATAEEEEEEEETEDILPSTANLDTIDTPLVKAVFSDVGGSIVGYNLKEYGHYKGGTVQLIPPGRRCITDSITLEGENYNLKDSIYTLKEKDGNSITYSLKLDGDREIIKTYTFSDTNYLFSLSIKSSDLESYTVAWDGGILFTEKNQQEELRFFSAVALTEGGLITNSLSSLPYEGEVIPSTAVRWLGIKNKYFLASIISEDIETKSINLRRFSKSPPRPGGCFAGRGCSPSGGKPIDPKKARMGVYLTTTVQPVIELGIFVGPLDYQLLTSYKYGLENAAYMGWKFIKPISRAILFIFNSLSRFIPNYGFVIIVFALLITFLFFPLTIFNQRTMSKTAEIQPRLQALQQKYKNDPQRLNKETMGLYRKSGVNPVSGCLPLLVQMPIFFALYAILQTTISLRGAEFFGWLRDLSQPDPYFVLPVVMGATMFFQQRIMGTQATQGESQRMFGYMMPVFLTLIFISLPSGIVLYWLSYNVFNIAQLLYIKNRNTKRELVEVKNKDSKG